MKVTTKTVIIGAIILAVFLWGYVIVGYMSDASGASRSVSKTNTVKTTPKTTTPAVTQPQSKSVADQNQQANVNQPAPVVYKPASKVNQTQVSGVSATPTPQPVSQPQSTPTPTPAPQPTPDPNQGACPAPTSQGVYFQRGTDPNTGQPICGFAYYDACPYTEAVSANDPMCYKAAENAPKS